MENLFTRKDDILSDLGTTANDLEAQDFMTFYFMKKWCVEKSHELAYLSVAFYTKKYAQLAHDYLNNDSCGELREARRYGHIYKLDRGVVGEFRLYDYLLRY